MEHKSRVHPNLVRKGKSLFQIWLEEGKLPTKTDEVAVEPSKKKISTWFFGGFWKIRKK
jgi:hypothetical protein